MNYALNSRAQADFQVFIFPAESLLMLKINKLTIKTSNNDIYSSHYLNFTRFFWSFHPKLKEIKPSTAPSAGDGCFWPNATHHHNTETWAGPVRTNTTIKIIITHYLSFFPYQQGHILLRQTLISQSYTKKTLCTTEAKDNDICCPCSNSCHRWITECSTPFSTSIFPLCCQARHPEFIIT